MAKKRKNEHLKKYNWKALKIEFLRSNLNTVAEFRREKNLPLNPNTAKKTKGWAKDKEEVRVKALEKATNKMVVDGSRNVEKDMIRQANIGKWMQLRGMEALKELTIDKSDDARKIIQTGSVMERAALGVGRGGANLTQVNVNLPKTRFDKILDGLDYEGTLKLIAEIKRIRARSSGVETVVDGTTEA